MPLHLYILIIFFLLLYVMDTAIGQTRTINAQIQIRDNANNTEDNIFKDYLGHDSEYIHKTIYEQFDERFKPDVNGVLINMLVTCAAIQAVMSLYTLGRTRDAVMDALTVAARRKGGKMAAAVRCQRPDHRRVDQRAH